MIYNNTGKKIRKMLFLFKIWSLYITCFNVILNIFIHVFNINHQIWVQSSRKHKLLVESFYWYLNFFHSFYLRDKLYVWLKRSIELEIMWNTNFMFIESIKYNCSYFGKQNLQFKIAGLWFHFRSSEIENLAVADSTSG